MLEHGELIGGDFEIERPLSQGGMGAVFLARQRSTDSQRVVKVMLPSLVGSPELRERFELEARATGRIRSEHVVKPIAYGVDAARGMPWLAMEYLPGATLEERVETQGRPDKRLAFELLRQLFHGVCAAHAAGIVHRDLKPGNIYVADAHRPDVPFTVKVLDFGIAKQLAVDPSATRAMGTRSWMAPEQEQSGAWIAPSADVWALGLIVFWLVSGRSFWLNAEGVDSMLSYEVHFAAMPSASQRAADFGLTLRSDAFDAWFAHSVARDPADRFRDAGASWEALSSVFDELPEWTGTLELPPISAPLTIARTTGVRSNFVTPQTTHAPGSVDLRPRTLPAPLAKANPLRPLVTGGVLVLAGAVGAKLLVNQELPATASVPAPSSAGAARSDAPTAASMPPARTASATASASVAPVASTPPAPEPPPGMVYVPPGSFVMGKGSAPPHGPERRVRIRHGFFVDRYEATVGEYRDCIRKKQCTPSGVHGPRPTPEEIEKFNPMCTGLETGRDTLPISCVDHAQASAYCGHRKKRLLTEAEWEYAARGGDDRAYPWGNDVPESCDMAVVSGLCAAAGPRAVGLRVPSSASPFGVFDMAGNLWEWVADTYEPQAHTLTSKDDPVFHGITARGVIRGGSWDFVRTRAESSYRQSFDQREGHVSTGIRCGSDLKPANPGARPISP